MVDKKNKNKNSFISSVKIRRVDWLWRPLPIAGHNNIYRILMSEVRPDFQLINDQYTFLVIIIFIKCFQGLFVWHNVYS